MDSTITQNSALYLAHRKVSKGRATLFQRLRAAASKHGRDAQRQLTSRDLDATKAFYFKLNRTCM
jgi:hypothetical protein